MSIEEPPTVILQSNIVKQLRNVYYLAARKLHKDKDKEHIKKIHSPDVEEISPSIASQEKNVKQLRNEYHLAAFRLHRLRDIERVKRKQVKVRTNMFEINQILTHYHLIKISHRKLEKKLTLFKEICDMLSNKVRILEEEKKKKEQE